MQQPLLMQFQDFPFNADNHICEQFLNLKKDYNITTAIETGSCFYSTTKWLGENFDSVYTVEINADFAKWGLHKVENMKNVHHFIDDSVSWLNYIAAMTIKKEERCIVFLDAHWRENCPLLGELEQLCNLETTQPPVIAIHDFFTGNPELGYDSYNGQDFTYEWIEPSVKKLEESFNCTYKHYFNTDAVGAKRGIIYLIPVITN